MSAARTERLLNLLTLLLNTKKPVSLRQIRELPEFEAYVSEDPKSGERAFERDKAALVELGIPLRWIPPEQDEDEEGGYLVDREKYYLPQIDLSPAELALLSIAGSAAATLEGFPGRAAVVRALAKLGFDVEESEARRAKGIAHAPLVPGLDAEALGQNLSVLHDAVGMRQRVHLTYVNAQKGKTARDVDPYGLYYSQGVWYLVGHCHLRQGERTFHLGRMLDPKPVGKPGAFEVPASFDLSAHVQKRPWEYAHEPPVEVRIRLAERLVPALGEIFGPHAVLARGPAGPEVRLVVRHKEALIAAVLPYGAAAEVLEPADLRQALRKTYASLAENYVA